MGRNVASDEENNGLKCKLWSSLYQEILITCEDKTRTTEICRKMVVTWTITEIGNFECQKVVLYYSILE